MLRDEPHAPLPKPPPPGYTLMFAGRRTAKTALLRLLLDTLDVAQTATPDQAEAAARFVKAATQSTTEVRALTLDVCSPAGGDTVRLTLVDTPSLDFDAAPGVLDSAVADLVGYVEAQYRRSLQDQRLADHHVHLCIYLLDPDDVIPFRARAGHSPRAKREHPDTDQPGVDPVELKVISRLAGRVNVLPVIARADGIMSDRLETIKKAVFKDLAREGLGFGIFDDTNMPRRSSDPSISRGTPTHYRAHSSSVTSVDASMRLLPYAVVTPDAYIYGDGVQRRTADPSWEQLVRQYMHDSQAPDRMAPGRLTRRYRWGTLDVTDPKHCDFVPFREAVFTHMETLKTYTYDHLFGRWKSDIAPLSVEKSLLATPVQTSPQAMRHPAASSPFGAPTSIPVPTATATAPSAAALGSATGTTAGANSPPNFAQYIPGTSQYNLATGVPKVRQKKILVACNFCRTRKLKCDGGRPACAQCVKRSNHCDYQPVLKRRGGPPKTKEEVDVDDLSAAHPSATMTATSPPQADSLPIMAGVKRPLSPTPSEDELYDDHPHSSYDERPSLPPIMSSDLPVRMPVSHLVAPGHLPHPHARSMSHPQLPPIQIPQSQHPQHLPHSALREQEAAPRYGYDMRDVDRERERLAMDERERERAYYERQREREWDRGREREREREREMEQRARLRDWEFERERERHYAASPPLPPHMPLSEHSHPLHSGHRRTASLPGPHPMSGSPILMHPHARAASGMLQQPSPVRAVPPGQLPLPSMHATSPKLDSARAADKMAMQLDKRKNGIRRAGSNYGPKTVACNFCRTRKTKCDGLHPKCSNCQKRNLSCEYLEDQRRRSSHMPKPQPLAVVAEQEAPSGVPVDMAAGAGVDATAQRLKKLAPAPSQEAASVSASSSSTSGRSPPMIQSYGYPAVYDDVPGSFAKRKGEELMSPRLKRMRADSPLSSHPVSRMAIGEMMDDPRARRPLTPVQTSAAW
ncbi:hypothetical protein EXIGLDRAFT_778795 [Exidia glandulosa HHB12029]|uniref:Zn(2)-C6 fungal-type domain-containing protein n=1 Tax=Exidia glandulosa HHB12029 TaxID=1314781 RepID=A0A165CDG0_EXIGL|nr:hypothetical protein EXIGLDRAFT_778795 [Exidia glandulosa HHB12029]